MCVRVKRRSGGTRFAVRGEKIFVIVDTHRAIAMEVSRWTFGFWETRGCNETTAASGPWEMQLPRAPVISIDGTRVLLPSGSQRHGYAYSCIVCIMKAALPSAKPHYGPQSCRGVFKVCLTSPRAFSIVSVYADTGGEQAAEESPSSGEIF